MDEKLNMLIETRNSEVFLRPRFTIDLDENRDKILQDFINEFKFENKFERTSSINICT